MKKLIRNVLLNFASFLSISFIYPGLQYENIEVLLLASFAFGLVVLLVKPILKFFSLPLNLFTFGLFSFLSGGLIIYLVSFFIDGFSVTGFRFAGLDVSGFLIPEFYAFPILAAILASIFISWLNTLLRWVFN